MEWLSAIPIWKFLIFTLVLVRTSGLMLTAPPFGSREVPMQVRAFFAVALAVLVAPLQWDAPAYFPLSPANLLLVATGELLIGLTLGTGLLLIFSGVQMAGQLIATTSGMQLADVFNPAFDSSMPLFSHLLFLFALAAFLVAGGHEQVLRGLLDTFHALPVGTGSVSSSVVGTLTTIISQSFHLGIRIAAPTTFAVLISLIVMGLLSRTLPQLNFLVFGFGVNNLVAIGALMLSLGGMAYLFQDHAAVMIDYMFEEIPASRGEDSLF